MPGYASGRRVTIVLPQSTLPADALDARVIFSAGGQEQTQAVQKPGGGWNSDLAFEFVWNGNDGFGRPVNGRVMATAQIGLTYSPSYAETAVFGLPPGASSGTASATREELTIWKQWNGYIGGLDASLMGLGGWTIDQHHAYSLQGHAIYFGSGGMTRSDALGDVIRHYAGKLLGTTTCSPAWSPCATPFGITVGSDGVLYLTYAHNSNPSMNDGELRAVLPDGSGTVVVAQGGGLYNPQAVAVADDGTLYIADLGVDTVFKLSNGVLTAVAGTGTAGDGGDGLGTSVALTDPRGVTVGPDGAVYIADTVNDKIRRLDATGYLTTVAGTGTHGNTNDGGLAIAANIADPWNIAFVDDGTYCFTSHVSAGRVRCVDPSGVISTIAGGGSGDGDGVAATSIQLEAPMGLARGLDGSLFVSQDYRIRRIAPNGIITSMTKAYTGVGTCSGEGVAALTAQVADPRSLAVDARGWLLVSDSVCDNVRTIAPAVLGQDADVIGQIAVPSGDGRELYVFDGTGRHLRTEDGHTGKIRFELTYDDFEVDTDVFQKLLVAIRDRRGSEGTNHDLVTEIQRSTDGTPTQIVSPDGHTTGLTLTNGYLTSVSLPDSAGSYTLGYQGSGNGLLVSLTDPKGGQHTYAYDDGLLEEDRDPATLTGDPFRALSRNVSYANNARTTTVTLTTAEGLSTQYEHAQSPDASTTRTITQPDGTATTTVRDSSGAMQTTLADGTVRAFTPIPDPRFGMAAATGEELMTLPGSAGKQLIVRTERSVSGGSGLQDFTTLTETRTTKKDSGDTGLTHTTEVDRSGSPHFTLETTPFGRKIRRELDAHGRVVQILQDHTSPEFSPVNIGYDNSGRITLISQGTPPNDRQTELIWHSSSGYLQFERRGTAADPDLFVTEYVTDALGRVRQIFRNTSGDGNQLKLTYDGNSNLTLVEIPTGNPSTFRAHSLPHLFTDLLNEYDPPNVSGVSPDVVDYDYDKDRRPTLIDWATAGKGIDFHYHATTGKLDQQKKLGTSTVLASYAYGSSGASSGKLTSITAGDITTSFAYAGIQTGWEGPLFATGTTWSSSQKDVSFTYDDYLRVNTETVTGGETVTFTYDADSLLTAAAVGSLGTISVNRSTKSGRVDSLTGGVVTTSLGYETTFGDLTLLETTCTGTTCTQSANCDSSGDCFVEDLTYDDLGRIETRTDTVQSSTNPLLTYEYDTQSRLWKVTPSGGSTATYAYDASGNKNGNRTSAPGQSLTYDEQDRISTSGYLHDNDGRLTSPDNGTTTYSYDDFGSLVSATLTGNVEIQYVYDGQRRRVTRKKLVNSVVTEERRYLYAQGNRLVAMYDGSGNLLQQYVYATGRHVPDAVIAGGVLYRIGTDHLGSVRVVVKQSDGTVVQRTEFDAWGELVGAEFVGTGWERVPFGFAGGLRDLDTGLVQMGARWYSPEVGRFVTKDPIRFDGGFNLYAYANNDPVNLIDPDGTWPLPIDTLPIRPWMFFPVPGRAEHMNRNLHNKCPKHVSQLWYDCDGTWSKSWSGSNKWRNSNGYECVYDDAGNLLPDEGSFNFGPVPWSTRHVFQDFLPFFLYGRENPGQTTVTDPKP